MYGDVGSAIIGEEGKVIIDIDPIVGESIHNRSEYYVFLQNEGKGESYILEKQPTYFIISGTPGLKVAWELKGRQHDIPYYRNEEFATETDEDLNYEEQAFDEVMAYLNTSTQEVIT